MYDTFQHQNLAQFQKDDTNIGLVIHCLKNQVESPDLEITLTSYETKTFEVMIYIMNG